MRLKCIIVDDEPLAISLLEGYVKQISFLDLVATFNDAMSALEIIKAQQVDVVFSDINMPQISGLEFSKMLPATTKVVFTTAYDQYAIESFKINALDYLLKPISYSEFLIASQRALDWFKLVDSNRFTSIFVKSGHRTERIDFNQILYIENQRDYVKFHLHDSKESISSLMSMQSLEEKLPSKLFMRVHRSFIVNLEKIKTIERSCIVFGKEYIPISDSYKEKFQEYLNKSIL